MATTCSDVFRTTYDGFIAAGRSTAQATAAAQSAMTACLQQTVAPIAAPQVMIPGGRLSDSGPTHPRQT